MKVIVKNDKTYYKYEKHKKSDTIKLAINFYIATWVVFILSIYISFMYRGNAPQFIAGLGFSAIYLDLASIVCVIKEIMETKIYYEEIRNMLALQILFLIICVCIV